MKIFRCLFLLALSLFLTPTFCLGQISGFEDLDTDSDGKVSKKEFLEYAKGKLANFEQVDKFVDRVDVDKDGFISEDEFDDRGTALQALNQEMLKEDDKKKEMSEEQQEMVSEATKAFEALAKMASKNEWEKASKGMTKQASEDYAIGMVTQSLSLTQMTLPPQMQTPAFEDAKDATVDVIKDYKLDDIDLSFFLKGRDADGNSSGDDGDDSDMTAKEKAKALQDKAKAQRVKLKTQVLEALDANDQRWEIVTALRKAQKGASFNRDILAGKVSDADADDSEVFLTVIQEKPAGQIAIPIVAKMKSDDGKWKYNGIDASRTQKAMQKMLQRRRAGGGADARPDNQI